MERVGLPSRALCIPFVWQLLLALEPEEQCSLVTRLLSLRGSWEWEGASAARVGIEGVESLKNLRWGT